MFWWAQVSFTWMGRGQYEGCGSGRGGGGGGGGSGGSGGDGANGIGNGITVVYEPFSVLWNRKGG